MKMKRLAALILMFTMTFPCIAHAEQKLQLKVRYMDQASEAALPGARETAAQILIKSVPADMIKYFSDHHGTIYIGSWDGSGGQTMLAIDDKMKPQIPDVVFPDCPLDMYVNGKDMGYGFMDDYLIHEFGHVFDARYGVTRNPAYDQVIASEIPAITQANLGIITDPMHYATTPEAFAQVYAAYRGGQDIIGGPATVAAAPGTVRIIKELEGRMY